jgi:predicted DNA-binding transcriptional regulator YafY
MSEVVRLYKIKSILAGGRVVSKASLLEKLEVSGSTFKRDITKLRDQLHTPIVYNSELLGYQINLAEINSELPGIWFSSEELRALLTIEQMLTQLEPGLLGPKLKPLQQRLSAMLAKQGISDGQLAQRVLMMPAGKRRMALKNFEAVAAATLGTTRTCINIAHYNRQNGELVHRIVSPQRLVYYRDNWYLDAWCHLRQALRSFAVDAIATCELLPEPALEIDSTELQQAMRSSYGIFNGAAKAWAKLRFTPERARWVSRETWHPEQRSATAADGSYLLELPYSDERELIGDLLRFGADVEVLAPPDLRNRMKRALHDAAGRYV